MITTFKLFINQSEAALINPSNDQAKRLAEKLKARIDRHGREWEPKDWAAYCDLSRDYDGELFTNTSLGAYPLYYLDNENNVLCAVCANKSPHEYSTLPIACDIHYEGEPLTCDNCNAEIESAYGAVEGEGE